VRVSVFPAILEDYSRLHDANCGFFDWLCDSFYADAVKDWRKVAVFEELFRDRIKWPLRSAVRSQSGTDADLGRVSLWYRKENESLAIQVDLPEDTIRALNEDENLNKAAGKALRDLYRYEGLFGFCVDELPF
jgi:hypothetical protein